MRFLLTRGTDWTKLRDWRILQLDDQPNLLTARKLEQMPSCLTPHEAARVTFRRFPGAEVFMWQHDPNYIPEHSIQGRSVCRVVGTFAPNGVWAVAKEVA